MSDISEAVHASAPTLHTVGVLDNATMRDFDTRYLAIPSEVEPAQIKPLRETNSVSQPMFARYLNTSEGMDEKWQTGANGMALKLLVVIQKHGLQVLARGPL